MERYQIFISYRREGGDILAGRLAERFTALGYKVFYDVGSMLSGTFNTQIFDAIAECNDVLLVLPPNALDRCVNDDDWVRQEISFALKHNKKIIPVMMCGFEFPKTLPADIDDIRHMEGIVMPSNEWFDAVIERIEKLLDSKSNSILRYRLDTKQYYKIRTPLINIYKRNNSTSHSNVNINIFLQKLLQNSGGEFQWSPLKYNTLRESLAHTSTPSVLSWYDKNSNRLAELQKKSIVLKQNLYFYANAVCFATGSMRSLMHLVPKNHYYELMDFLCYILDIPAKYFDELFEAFNKGDFGYQEFKCKLPLALDAWPDMKKGNRINSEKAHQFDAFAIAFFDFMIELSIFILDNLNNQELTAVKTGQIRSYYKWLKKHKIYLPKELQEKIYRYL